MKVVYDWLKEYVGEEMPTIEKLEELLTFHAFEIDGVEKVGTQTVIDVKVLPDRASDALSHRGIAREISTLIGVPLTHDPLSHDAPLEPLSEAVSVSLESPELCSRFGVALVTGLAVAESPHWLKERLQALGQRSINNVVDATNYVMLALGQPLHAYDANKFTQDSAGVWHFGVRRAREDEKIVSLTKDTYVLNHEVPVIVDAHTDTPMGVAGIKGGMTAVVDTHTTAILIEAAHFNPQTVRKASQVLKLQTDASKRFENNVSAELIPHALTEVVKLITEIAGGKGEGYFDLYPKATQNPSVTVSKERIEALLGVTFTSDIIENIFERLGFTTVFHDGVWDVTAPFERADIQIPEDVIAEVGRVHGYSHIAAVVPDPVEITEYNARHVYGEKIRSILIERGFSEIITSSFREKDQIELLNHLASDKGCLRSALASNITDALDKNILHLDILGLSQIRIFEIGTVFNKSKKPTDVTEHVSLAIGVRTKTQGSSPVDNTAVTDAVKALEKEFGISFDGTISDGVFECNLTQLVNTVPTPTEYAPVSIQNDIVFTPYSPYPHISRDIALWVSEGVTADQVKKMISDNAGPLLVRLFLFDEFKKEGRVSYAFRLVFQSFERTLTDDEVGEHFENVVAEAKNQSYEVR